MSFFNSLYNSLYNFKWLRNQKNNTNWAWGYFFLLIFFVAGLSTISIGLTFWNEAPKIKQQIVTDLPEFQAELKSGKIFVTGIAQPFIKKYDSLTLVVDTTVTNTVGVKSFLPNDSTAGVLLSNDRIEFYDPDSKEIKSQDYKGFSDFKTDRTGTLKTVDIIFSNKMLTIVTAITFFVLFIFLAVFNLLNILLFSWVFYLLAKRNNLDWKFKEILNIGLFAVSLPLIMMQASSDMYLNLFAILIFVGWMYLVVIKKDKVVK